MKTKSLLTPASSYPGASESSFSPFCLRQLIRLSEINCHIRENDQLGNPAPVRYCLKFAGIIMQRHENLTPIVRINDSHTVCRPQSLLCRQPAVSPGLISSAAEPVFAYRSYPAAWPLLLVGILASWSSFFILISSFAIRLILLVCPLRSRKAHFLLMLKNSSTFYF